jgi:hypothetical protein
MTRILSCQRIWWGLPFGIKTMPLASNNKGMSLRTTLQRSEAVSFNAQETFEFKGLWWRLLRPIQPTGRETRGNDNLKILLALHNG